MKKQNIRVRRNGGSKTASPQVLNQPDSAWGRGGNPAQRATEPAGAKVSFGVEPGDKGPRAVVTQVDEKQQAAPVSAGREWSDRLKCLFPVNEQTDDSIWASPEGQLYLWDGCLDRGPREVTFDIARVWFGKFHNFKFEFAAPCFKEDSAAARLVGVVCDQWKKRQEEMARKLAPPNLEDAIRESVALNALLVSHIAHPEADIYAAGPDDLGTFNCGLMLLCNQARKRLLEAFYGRKGGAQ